MNREQQRAAARAAAAFTAEPVKVPLEAWGGDIFVKRVTVEAALAQRDAINSADTKSVAQAVARRICDESGEATFDATSEEDLALLMSQGVDWLTQLNEAIGQIDSPGKPSPPSASS